MHVHILTGDRVVITPSSSTPECFVVCRPDEEKTASPDRLNLDRCAKTSQ